MTHRAFMEARRRVVRGLALSPWMAGSLAASAVGSLAAGTARASSGGAGNFPSHPLTFIVPWAAGGGGDIVVRMLTTKLSDRVGQPIVVENRGGATGTIGSAQAARSKPDGYTVVYATADSHFIFPQLYKQSPYDALRDFSPVAPIGYFQFGLAVHPSIPARNAQEFLALVRQSPRKYTYGTWGVGSTAQLVMENFKAEHGLDILHVPYQGTAPELLGLASGQVDAAILPMQITDGYVKDGKIRMLGLGSPERYATLPDLPTLREQGMDLDLRSAVGLLGPANIPAPILARLNDELGNVMRDPTVQDNLRTQYIVPQIMKTDEYRVFLQSEYQRWGGIVRNSRVQIE